MWVCSALRAARGGPYLCRLMPFAHDPRGARIHYEVHGDEGPWAVLVMGVGASSAMWFDLPQRLAGGEAPRRVVTIDNRGTGHSDPLRRPTSIGEMARDVLCVMDAVGAARADIVGLSMGGMIAQHLALRHPERVEGLVLLATTPGVRFAGPPGPRAVRGILRSAIGPARGRAAHAVRDLILARAERHRTEEILDVLRPTFGASRFRPEALALQILACAAHSTGRDLRRIRKRTIVVTGDDDCVMGRYASRFLAENIPNASLEVLPRCGHGLTFTHPEAVERAVARLRTKTPADVMKIVSC